MDYFKESLKLHKRLGGKIKVISKIDVRTKDDLSLVYSPGVAEPCREIAKHPEKVWDYTKSITPAMKLAAAFAIADYIDEPTSDYIIPPTLNEEVAWKVANAVRQAAL